MTIELPDLPYEFNALEPYISAETMRLHYGKHHRGYVNKLNKAIADSDYAGLALEEIVTKAKDANDTNVFNNAAQAWNHAFLWQSMAPEGGGVPRGRLRDAVEADFGSVSGFRDAFRDAALSRFGSGWVWLVNDSGRLDIVTTGNAGTPLTGDASPLLTLDVWEHAYYLDYRNERKRYVGKFLDHLINWEFAADNFEAVRKAA